MTNISKIISTVLLSFSILLLSYVFYRSQILHNGTKFDYYLKYYIIAFSFIILSSVSFFIPKKLKINITIALISSLIGLYLSEGYLTMKNYSDSKKLRSQEMQNNSVIYKNNTGKDYDKRTRFEVYRDLKKEDLNVVVAIFPMLFLNDKNINYLPLSGISNRRTIHCNGSGYYSIYQSDRYGFNNPDKEWDKNGIEFFLLGDSFVHGHCVNEPDTISGNLRKLITNRGGVLNLGMNRDLSLSQYATLKEYLPVKKVKRVLWFYVEGTLLNLVDELNNKILINYLNDKSFTQDIISREQEIQKILLKKLKQEVLKQEESSRSKSFILIQFAKLNLMRKVLFPDPVFDPSSIPIEEVPIEKFENILKLSNEFVKQNNSKLYFVYLPRYLRYTDNNNHDNLFNYKKINEVVENLNIPIIDINKELFIKYDDPISLFTFRKKGHYNEKAYQLVAETIFKKINELEK